MGSFADTCCISGLPIEWGDEVRYLLLTENPYFEGGFVCYPYGRWVPRTWPIKAKYNDYGSIEDWEENAVQRSFLEGLKVDMIEVGVGDNSIHDVATSKDMSFEQMLNAVWEGRVIVDREPDRDDRNKRMRKFLEESDKRNGNQRTDPISEWKPTLQNVSEIISSIDIPEGCRYLVDEKDYWVRVRWDGLRGEYGKDREYLDMASGYLEDRFAVVMTAGSNINTDCELRCFPAPTPLEFKRAENRDMRSAPDELDIMQKGKPLLVQQAMIREDVWQALIKHSISGWRGTFTADNYRDGARKLIEERLAVYDKLNKYEPGSEEYKLAIRMAEFGRGDEPGTYLAAKEIIPFSTGLASHFNMILKSGDAPEDFADVVGEFHLIYSLLHTVRYVWRPSDTCGPQFGEWGEHSKYFESLLEVSRENERRRNEEYDEDEL